jgi:hypothetical protein
MGTTQIMSVPYALHAKTADSIVGGGTGNGGFTHYIGEQFGGGVVFHLWKDAQGAEHGLIVDLNDLGQAEWSNIVCDTIGISAKSYWNGLSNSNSIVAQGGHTNSAAALCLNSNNGGFDDWYLPSLQECNLIRNNYYAISKKLNEIVGSTEISSTEYWTSNESTFNDVNNKNAENFLFYPGTLYQPNNYLNNLCNNGSSSNKIITFKVRAIRAF